MKYTEALDKINGLLADKPDGSEKDLLQEALWEIENRNDTEELQAEFDESWEEILSEAVETCINTLWDVHGDLMRHE